MHAGNLGVGESIAQKAAPWCLVLNLSLCIKCKPWGGLVLTKISPSWQVRCFSMPSQDSFALFYEDGLSMTVRYRGHHCTQLCLGVVSPVGRDGRPPTLIMVGPRTEREREKGGGSLREGVPQVQLRLSCTDLSFSPTTDDSRGGDFEHLLNLRLLLLLPLLLFLLLLHLHSAVSAEMRKVNERWAPNGIGGVTHLHATG